MNRKRLIFTAGLVLCLFAVVVIGNRHAINAQIHLQNAEALFGEALFRNLVEATGHSQTACRAYANGLIAESSQTSEAETGIFFRHVDECDGRRILFALKELASENTKSGNTYRKLLNDLARHGFFDASSLSFKYFKNTNKRKDPELIDVLSFNLDFFRTQSKYSTEDVTTISQILVAKLDSLEDSSTVQLSEQLMLEGFVIHHSIHKTAKYSAGFARCYAEQPVLTVIPDLDLLVEQLFDSMCPEALYYAVPMDLIIHAINVFELKLTNNPDLIPFPKFFDWFVCHFLHSSPFRNFAEESRPKLLYDKITKLRLLWLSRVTDAKLKTQIQSNSYLPELCFIEASTRRWAHKRMVTHVDDRGYLSFQLLRSFFNLILYKREVFREDKRILKACIDSLLEDENSKGLLHLLELWQDNLKADCRKLLRDNPDSEYRFIIQAIQNLEKSHTKALTK